MKKILPITFFVFLIDYVSKQLVLHFLNMGSSVVIIKDFFSFTLTKNTGIAFSLLDGRVSFIIFMTFFIICFLFYLFKKENYDFGEVMAYSFILGGAFGNLFDRIIYGYVIDFLDFNIFGYDYPIFNLADSFIVIGVILVIIFDFRKGRMV